MRAKFDDGCVARLKSQQIYNFESARPPSLLTVCFVCCVVARGRSEASSAVYAERRTRGMQVFEDSYGFAFFDGRFAPLIAH